MFLSFIFLSLSYTVLQVRRPIWNNIFCLLFQVIKSFSAALHINPPGKNTAECPRNTNRDGAGEYVLKTSTDHLKGGILNYANTINALRG